MRRLYLIRHGLPDFPPGERLCLGLAQRPLSKLGRLQACLAGAYMREQGIETLFSSRLDRALETAKLILPEPVVLEGLEEMSAGDWDGLSFSQIRKDWPELYALRGEKPDTPIPGAEDVYAGQRRFKAAVLKALEQSEGDIAICAHATVIQSFICAALGVEPTQGRQFALPYGSYSRFSCQDGFHLEERGVLPRPKLSGQLCMSLHDAIGNGEGIKTHCQAVAGEALSLARSLGKAGVELDQELILSAALLHDIARCEPEHDALGMAWLKGLGYEREADIIAVHHDFQGEPVSEAGLVYIADKLLCESGRVSLEQRFQRSREKCRTSQALAAHERRYAQARAVRDSINKACNEKIII